MRNRRISNVDKTPFHSVQHSVWSAIRAQLGEASVPHRPNVPFRTRYRLERFQLGEKVLVEFEMV